MESELQNANPTILSLAQLPQRRRVVHEHRAGPESKYSDVIFGTQADRSSTLVSADVPWPSSSDASSDDGSTFTVEPIDEQEIYDLIAPIADPEHETLTLGQLAVVNLPDIHLNPPPGSGSENGSNTITQVLVDLTPTINHCSMATIIGLGVRVKLEQSLPPNFRVDVRIKAGTHAQDDQTNKQLADKERVAAAMENADLMQVLGRMLRTNAA